MFYNHKIEIENNEETLYLYVDFNYEFGSFKKNKNRVIDEIKTYLSRVKVNFTGKKICLVISGIVIGTILLTTPINNIKSEITEDNTSKYQYVVVSHELTKDIILKEKMEIEEKIEKIVDEIDNKKEEIIANANNKIEQKKEQSNKKNTNTNKNSSKKK